MATRRREDHDLDLNGHRLLTSQGEDASFNADGDLVLGNGNYFVVSAAGAEKVLRRIALSNWLPGAPVFVKFSGSGITIEPGATASGGFGGIQTPDDEIVAIRDGQLAIFVVQDGAWAISFGVGAAADDHLVFADASDTVPGTLLAKTANEDNLSRAIATVGGVRVVKLGVAISTATPLPPCPGGSSGDTSAGARPASYSHRHPEVPASVAGSYLYTSRIKDPLDFGQVVCVFMSYSSCDASIFAGWTEVAPGVMQHIDTGPRSSALLDGVGWDAYNPSGTSSMIGKVVFAFDYGLTDENKKLTGPWLIEDVGGHYENYGTPEQVFVNTHARMRRAPGFTRTEDFIQGMTFQVQTGNTFGADFITLATAIPVLGEPLTWTVTEGPTYPWAYKYELLSSAQLATENVDTETADMSVTTASGSPGVPAIAHMEHAFTTLPGTPGITKLAAGPQEFHFEQVSLYTTDVTGVTKLRVRLIITEADGGTTVHDLDPMTEATITPNVTAQNLVIPYVLPAYIDMTTVQRFVFLLGISTTCSSPATLTVRVNSPLHGTYWKGTFQLPAGGGTNWHPDQMGRDVEKQHPKYSIDDPSGTVTVSGTLPKLTVSAKARNASFTISTSQLLYGIDPTGFNVGDELTLFVEGCTPAAPLTLVHLGLSDGSQIYTGVVLATGVGQNKVFSRPAALLLKRRADHWRLMYSSM